MIRTDTEYRRTLEQLEQDAEYIRSQRKHFESLGLTEEQIERALQPAFTFHEQLKEEADGYEQMKRGDLGTLHSLTSIGRWLIGSRIARGWSQKELAEALGVSEAQVSRDERNEYYGITVERAQRILEVIGLEFQMQEADDRPLLSTTATMSSSASVPPGILNTPDWVAARLRGDPKLDGKKAQSLAQMFRFAYEAVASEEGS
jgi:transcriptional regulator with XRE-family HTH domain